MMDEVSYDAEKVLDEIDCNLINTDGLDILCEHKKTICRETKRDTTDLNIQMKSTQQGTPTGAG